MRRPIRYLLTSAFVLPVVAQEPATRATQEQPVFVLKTADPKALAQFARGFGCREQTGDLEPGSHYVLSVDGERVTSVRTEAGKVRYLEISVDPGGLMDVFADEIGEVKGMVQGLGVLAMSQQGFSVKEATAMVRSVFDFPHTLENATLALASNPDDVLASGLEIEVGITARPDSQLGKALPLLRSSSAGVPVLPRSPATLMTVQISIDPAGMKALFEPFLDLILSFNYPDEDARGKARDVWSRMLEMYDGGYAMGFAKNMEIEGLYGFLDAKVLTELLASDAYTEMLRLQQPSRDIEVEIEANAFEHRGAPFTRMTLYNDGMPNPMMPNGEMRSYFAGVGNYLVMGGNEARAKALADAVADKKVQRKPLADGAVMVVDMQLKAWMQAVTAAAKVSGALEEMPDSLSMRAFATGRTVKFAIKIR